MFGSIFNTTQVDEFADWVVNEVKRVLPAGFDPTLRNVAEKVEALDKRIAKRTEEFTRTTSVNLYKKARLVSRVRDSMQEYGYPESFVKSFSMNILERIQVAKKAAKA